MNTGNGKNMSESKQLKNGEHYELPGTQEFIWYAKWLKHYKSCELLYGLHENDTHTNFMAVNAMNCR